MVFDDTDKARSDQAKDFFSKAIKVLEECDADVALNQAKEAMGSLV